MKLDELEEKWNANADYNNLWSDLGIDEILDFAQKEIAKLERNRWREATEYAAHQLEKARVWGGMGWHYNPLHPMHYRSALERLRDVLRDSPGELDEGPPRPVATLD